MAKKIGRKKKANHYVDNERLFDELCEFRIKVRDAKDMDLPRPRLSEFIGKCILDIAVHRSREHNFIGYPFREEMVSDGIENCILYIDNFTPDKSNNPFAYFSQIIYFAFLRRIGVEKKKMYTKFKLMEDVNWETFTSPLSGFSTTPEISHNHTDWSKEYINTFIKNFEESKSNAGIKKKNKSCIGVLDTDE